MQNYGAGDLLEIDGADGRFFVAFTREAVPDISLRDGRVTIIAPDPDDSEDS